MPSPMLEVNGEHATFDLSDQPLEPVERDPISPDRRNRQESGAEGITNVVCPEISCINEP
jgi:hypothetical protein